ncbi:effector-associated constant component EACC1 [Streptomyces sp. N2A]|uniref:effector-associated constant component EACC1 n=1 Tax=Streptomyces sp. N2A TaxID=3073936 RepID=UPI002870B0A0|nr:hypothetical protein [Streptomyces sp. N2A]
MDIRLTVQGEVHNVAQESLTLRRWLVHNPPVISSAEVSFPRSTRVGAQPGLSLEEINVIAQTAFSFASLVVAIASWRRQRKGQPPVTIECQGVTVRLLEGTPEETEEAIRSLNALRPEPAEPSDDGSAGDDGAEGADAAC